MVTNSIKVLITGGHGFIGKSLCRIMGENGEYEILSPQSTELNVVRDDGFRVFENCGVDGVIHLAAKTFIPDIWNNPQPAMKCNIAGTISVLDYCRRNRCKLTFISSYLYGNPQLLPINEKAPLMANNPYAMSKMICEELCEFYSKNYNIDITVLRPFNVYGPGQKESFLIPTIINQAMGMDSSIIVNSLNTRRDYVYVDDLCDAIIRSVSKCEGFNVYNVGSGMSYSTVDIIERVQNILGISKTVVSRDIQRKNEVEDTIADISKIKKELEWTPRIGIEEGLKLCIDGVKSQRR